MRQVGEAEDEGEGGPPGSTIGEGEAVLPVEVPEIVADVSGVSSALTTLEAVGFGDVAWCTMIADVQAIWRSKGKEQTTGHRLSVISHLIDPGTYTRDNSAICRRTFPSSSDTLHAFIRGQLSLMHR